jgi:molybdopterin-guanine dinucleotide biosynthesis protein B
MIPIVSFIGWHDAGKTTIVGKVIDHLKQMNLRVGVIKSTQHTDIVFDKPGSDSDAYRKAGAATVALLAPDQIFMISGAPRLKLVEIAHRYFHDVDIIIGEGFKNEPGIKKIEVTRKTDSLLRDTVSGVIAVVTDQPLAGDFVFRSDQSQEIAQFIRRRMLDEPPRRKMLAVLYVNGRKIPMKDFVQEALAGTVNGFVRSLKKTDNIQDIDLTIKLERPAAKT